MKKKNLIWSLPLLASLVVAIMCFMECVVTGSIPRITNLAIIEKIGDWNLTNLKHPFSFPIFWEIPVAFIFAFFIMLLLKLVANWKAKVKKMGQNSANVVNSGILGVVVGLVFSLALTLGSSLEISTIIGIFSLLVFGLSFEFLIIESRPSPLHLLLVCLTFCIFLSVGSSLVIGFALDSITLGFMTGLAISFVSVLIIFSITLLLKVLKAVIMTFRFLGQKLVFTHIVKRDD